jgi:hypothetical protein
MTKGKEALMQTRLSCYEKTGEWDYDLWGQLPPLLDEGAFVMEVEEEEDVDDQAELLRETGS